MDKLGEVKLAISIDLLNQEKVIELFENQNKVIDKKEDEIEKLKSWVNLLRKELLGCSLVIEMEHGKDVSMHVVGANKALAETIIYPENFEQALAAELSPPKP